MSEADVNLLLAFGLAALVVAMLEAGHRAWNEMRTGKPSDDWQPDWKRDNEEDD